MVPEGIVFESPINKTKFQLVQVCLIIGKSSIKHMN